MSAILDQLTSLADKLLFGSNPQLKKSDLKKIANHIPFSKYLNYSSFDHGLGLYINGDCSLGMLWECVPLTFAGLKTVTTLEGLFRANLPKNSVLQFTLYSDDHIEPIIERFKSCRLRKSHVINASTEKISEFIRDGRAGLKACSGIPIRNFRLFVAVTIPGDSEEAPDPSEFENESETMSIQDMQRQIVETLRAAQLSPRLVTPDILVEWLRRFFNTYPDGYPENNINVYSDDLPLNKQIINADTVIRKTGEDSLQIGNKHVFCVSPKTIPTPINPLQTNQLFGGIWGHICDMDQIKTKFIYTLNLVFEKGLEAEIHGKCNLFLSQKGGGSLGPMLERKKNEYLSAVDAVDHGVKFVKVIPILTIMSPNRTLARESATRARRLWEDQGYVMQQETMLSTVLFLSALPFGMRIHNLADLERDFIAPVSSVTPLLPVQSDFRGSGVDPKVLFIGRKGQLIIFDLFAKGVNNHNLLIAATSGSGKSFLVNYLVYNYYACGAKIRIIDIGGSYKKMANLLGVYLDFAPGTNICLNPFTNIREPDEELKAVAAVFAQMAYSHSDTGQCNDTEMNLILSAVRYAWWKLGNNADSDTVYRYLDSFPHLENEKRKKEASEKIQLSIENNIELSEQDKEIFEINATPLLVETATTLAFNMREYTSEGSYKNYFIGPSSFDIKNDNFVVLELEHLKVQPDLYRVVTLLVIDAVTQDLYLSDRSTPRFIIFEEAWQFLGKAAQLGAVVEEGYRRARKYSGSFSVVVQSLMDLNTFGTVGGVINGNSQFRLFLESPDFDKSKDKGILDYDEFTMEYLKSVKSLSGFYSEIFFETPFGYGIGRLIVNPYDYFVYTSNGAEVSEMNDMYEKLMQYYYSNPDQLDDDVDINDKIAVSNMCHHKVFLEMACRRG